MKKIFITLLTCLITLCGCNTVSNKTKENYPTIQVEDLTTSYIPKDNDSFKEATNKYSDFSLKIFKQAYKDNEDNSMISPYSLFVTLSILANGTNNDTRKLMETVLGMNVEDLNNFNRDFIENNNLNSANGLWFNNSQNISLKEDYKNTINTYYGIDSIKETSFQDTSSLVNEINDWAKTKSDNTIDNMLSSDDVSKDDSFLLLNALSVSALWELPFNSSDTYKETFNNLDGSTSDVDMMHQTIDGYWQSEDATGFVKEAGQYYFVGILPNEDVGFDTFVSNLDSAYINSFINSEISMENYDPNTNTADLHKTVLSFPKFSFSNEYDLSNHLKQLGLNEIFNSADFSNMADGDIDKLRVSNIKQKTNVEVNEKEVKMSAVTLVQSDMGGAGPTFNIIEHEVKFDRPFIFMLVKNEYFSDSMFSNNFDNTTKAHFPLFIGSISNFENE